MTTSKPNCDRPDVGYYEKKKYEGPRPSLKITERHPKNIKFKDPTQKIPKEILSAFSPNLTPRQMFLFGIFGGTYFREIDSAIVKKHLKNQHKEFTFLQDIPEAYLCTQLCWSNINKYGVFSGTSKEFWETKGWIKEQDPYGWVQWYCRFYNGRRSPDDIRQIKRWMNFAGPNGRFRRHLIKLVNAAGGKKHVNDYSVAPVVRQGLLQWGYELVASDL